MIRKIKTMFMALMLVSSVLTVGVGTVAAQNSTDTDDGDERVVEVDYVTGEQPDITLSEGDSAYWVSLKTYDGYDSDAQFNQPIESSNPLYRVASPVSESDVEIVFSGEGLADSEELHFVDESDGSEITTYTSGMSVTIPTDTDVSVDIVDTSDGTTETLGTINPNTEWTTLEVGLDSGTFDYQPGEVETPYDGPVEVTVSSGQDVGVSLTPQMDEVQILSEAELSDGVTIGDGHGNAIEVSIANQSDGGGGSPVDENEISSEAIIVGVIIVLIVSVIMGLFAKAAN